MDQEVGQKVEDRLEHGRRLDTNSRSESPSSCLFGVEQDGYFCSGLTLKHQERRRRRPTAAAPAEKTNVKHLHTINKNRLKVRLLKAQLKLVRS